MKTNFFQNSTRSLKHTLKRIMFDKLFNDGIQKFNNLYDFSDSQNYWEQNRTQN
jgi:hypothetical protein